MATDADQCMQPMPLATKPAMTRALVGVATGCVGLYCDTKASGTTYTVDEKGRDDDLLQVPTRPL